MVLLLALAAAGTATGAATPIQRLTYTKAVAYWTAQAKAHRMPIACTPWTSKWVGSDYTCTFGKVNRVDVSAQPKCQLVVDVYGADVTGALMHRVANTRVTLCKRGWQATLPTPWNLPPSS